MKSAKVADSVCKMCSHRTQGFDSYIYAVQNVSLDCSKGWYQSLQNIFSADLRRTLPCAQVACKAPQGLAGAISAVALGPDAVLSASAGKPCCTV